MSTEIKVNAEQRTCSGSSAARRLRRAGVIPAVLANIDGATELIQLSSHDFERVMSRHGDAQIMMSINIGGKDTLALLREVQRDHLTGRISHADFSQVDTTRKMRLQIQIVLTGEPDGVRNQNGVLEQQIRHIEVECLPTDAIENFTVDTTSLKLGEDILVASLDLGDKIEIITPKDTVIANVAEATEEVVTETSAAEAAEGAVPAQPELSVKKGRGEAEGEPAATDTKKK